MNTSSSLSKLIITLTALSSLFLFGACAEIEGDEGVDSVNKVIGGKVVQNAPDHVGVLLIGVDEFHSFCTATLIDNDSILTAAHCWDDQELMQQAIELGVIHVCLGDRDWGKKDGLYCSRGEMAQITNFTVHPKYNEDPNRHDIAVAQLGSSFPNLSKPKLASRQSQSKGRTKSYGYGLKTTRVLKVDPQTGEPKVQNQGRSDSKLRVLTRQTLSTADCNDKRCAEVP